MLSSASVDPVSLRLDEKLTHLSGTDSECYIYKVHDRLCWQNEKLYEPEIMAIGPYHHGRNETSVDRYIVAMRDLQERALRCYANSVWLNKDEFVKMMLLDSCFLVELFLKFTITSIRDRNDPLFKIDWILPTLWRDSLLFENQLPFFVLVELFNMIKVLDPHDNITDLAIRYHHCVSQYASLGPVKILYAYNGISTCGVKHFLGLDVSLLCRYGILKNMLGGDEVVVSILNKISTCVVAPRDNFYYSQVFDDVSRYSKQRRNIWTAMLRRNYFNSPWIVISFLGAIMLLLLTLTQTVFSILAYFYNRGC
ncbi:hypothetical protein CsSME_00020356 [Camellia sinensis var. sinensis]